MLKCFFSSEKLGFKLACLSYNLNRGYFHNYCVVLGMKYIILKGGSVLILLEMFILQIQVSSYECNIHKASQLCLKSFRFVKKGSFLPFGNFTVQHKCRQIDGNYTYSLFIIVATKLGFKRYSYQLKAVSAILPLDPWMN